MMGDDDKEDIIATELSDETLENVDGGITMDNGLKRAAGVKGLKIGDTGNDTIMGFSSNDTLFAGSSGDKTFKRR